jgi:hypothetical protein
VASITCHKLDTTSMVHVSLLRARQDFRLDGTDTVQDRSSGRSCSGVLGDALYCELSEFGRTSRVGHSAHFFSVDGERRRGAGKMTAVSEAARRDFGEDDAEREDVGGKTELEAEEDLGRHIGIRAAKGETTGLFLIACRNAGKAKVCDLEATVRGHEEVLAFEVAMNAFASMKVGEGAGNVGSEGESETPRQRLGFVVDVLAEVACGWSKTGMLGSPGRSELPFSMNSEMIKMRQSGSGARESPRYKTTLGCRDSLYGVW